MKSNILLYLCIFLLAACANPSGQTKKERDLADKEEFLKVKEQELMKKEKEELEEERKALAVEKEKINAAKPETRREASPSVSASDESTARTATTNNPPPSSSPDAFVGGFLRNLGGQEFSKAFSKCDIPHLKSFPSLSYFGSTKAYGGITRIDTKKLRVVSESNDAAKVYALYYAEDPYNKNGDYEQYFHLTNKGGEWKITKIETINMRQY